MEYSKRTYTPDVGEIEAFFQRWIPSITTDIIGIRVEMKSASHGLYLPHTWYMAWTNGDIAKIEISPDQSPIDYLQRLLAEIRDRVERA